MISPHLYISKTTNKGRGIFTSKNIEQDTIVEISPVIEMNEKERQLLDQTLLHDYIFEWQPEGKNMCCMALGWIPIYNHSRKANCEYFMDYEEQSIFIKTVRKISAGEELTINYNGDWNEEKEVWFEAME